MRSWIPSFSTIWNATCSMSKGVLFTFIAGAKTLCDIGAVFLTVDTAVRLLSDMGQHHEHAHRLTPAEEGVDLTLQITAATFSLSIIMLSRYPKIWRHVSVESLENIYAKMYGEIKDLTKWKKSLIFIAGTLGLVSCAGRGMQAYVGTEVILQDVWGLEGPLVDTTEYAAGTLVALSAACFNWPNMLKDLGEYLKEPGFDLSLRSFVGRCAVVTTALYTRFFVMHFLLRQNANNATEIALQTIFTTAEAVISAFTTGSIKAGSWSQYKKILCDTPLLGILLTGDAFFALFFCYTITNNSTFLDLFFPEAAVASDVEHHEHALHGTDYYWQWAFLVLSLIMAVPTTISYFAYLMPHAKKGYKNVTNFLATVRNRLIGNAQPTLTQQPLAEDGDGSGHDYGAIQTQEV